MDRLLIERICHENDSWYIDQVKMRYKYGIDWDQLRATLNDNGNTLTPKERRALTVVACGALWPEERRWKCGIHNSPECVACGGRPSNNKHRLHRCDAMVGQQVQWRLMGSLQREPNEVDEDGVEPLTEYGWPPVRRPWAPIELQHREGALPVTFGRVYGDGSGYMQQHVAHRVATWSTITLQPGGAGECEVQHRSRGTADGWFPTVPRAELRAFVNFARHAGPGSTFISDCRYVVEGVLASIPKDRTSSAELHADLWREAEWLQADHGAPFSILKIKAHRSRAKAVSEANGELNLTDWIGNDKADEYAKELTRSIVEADDREAKRMKEESTTRQILLRIAMGAAWAFERWPIINGDGGRGASSVGQAVEIPDEERHALRRSVDGGIECSVCRRTARGAAAIKMKQACAGTILERIHGTHQLRDIQGVVWCVRCGAYTSRWPRNLLRPCPGRPLSAAQANVLRRLTEGKPPTTACYLEQVALIEGRPAGAVAHEAEVRWRATARDRTDDAERGARMISAGASNARDRLAKPPVGCYLRLRGGPLYRSRGQSAASTQPQDGAQNDGGSGGGVDQRAGHGDQLLHRPATQDANAPSNDAVVGVKVVKRRLRGKQRPASTERQRAESPAAATAHTAMDDGGRDATICAPVNGSPWGARTCEWNVSQDVAHNAIDFNHPHHHHHHVASRAAEASQPATAAPCQSVLPSDVPAASVDHHRRHQHAASRGMPHSQLAPSLAKAVFCARYAQHRRHHRMPSGT